MLATAQEEPMNKYTPRTSAATITAISLASETRAALVAYVRRKVEEQDWAAVSAAATDLCDMEILEARSMAGARAVGLTA
jgi:hypothetical protein